MTTFDIELTLTRILDLHYIDARFFRYIDCRVLGRELLQVRRFFLTISERDIIRHCQFSPKEYHKILDGVWTDPNAYIKLASFFNRCLYQQQQQMIIF